jgi:hypothetical protein
MLRNLIFASFAMLPFAACADDPLDDELAGETSEDGEAGKGDSVDAFTFFKQRPDVGPCTADQCSFFVSRANRSYTNCLLDQGSFDECEVDIDLTRTGMSASQQQSYRDRLWNEEKILLRGELVENADKTKTILAITELWVPQNGGPYWPDDGTYVRLADNGLRCITSPCANIGEQRINSSRDASIHMYDLSQLGIDDETVTQADDAIYGGDGVIVVGDRYYKTDSGITTKGRRANELYFKAPR